MNTPDGKEPGGEREPRAGEERAGGEGDLVLAGVALEELAGAQAAVAAGAAGAATVAARPARLVDGFGALRLAAVALQEGSQTQAFLELNSIALHYVTPYRSAICTFHDSE